MMTKTERTMTKMLVLYYSSYGHTEKMALAAAEGARSAGADVSLKRVPELVPQELAKSSYYKMEQEGDIADPMELANYDGIIFATPTRFGMMAAQMKNFLDMTGGLWFSGALEGRVGTVMVSTASQHGGAEATILSFQTVLLHHGMVITGLPYSYGAQNGSEEVKGCSPYGASTIANSDGSRQPSKIELDGAAYQAAYATRVAAALAAAR
jgi:NAD(P)H dehydrogenase (quinone)